MNTLILPPQEPGKANESWSVDRSVIITGANGSGKTRLGAWIEDNNAMRAVHRVAAQRALNLPDLVNPVPYERAILQLHYGAYSADWSDTQYKQNKRHSRWRGKPVEQMLSDYDSVLSTLFADESRRNREYAIGARSQLPAGTAPDCNLDILQKIWRTIFPHRELVISQDKIAARVSSTAQPYAGSMMSDGERVALYLLGQVLCAPPKAIIVIDEPEIHLHRAIQATLWDEAEASRPDCTFVYITHDLEFASTRSAARKIWAESYDGSHWRWHEVHGSHELPDELIFQILGSRRPVLLVEGDEKSYDAALYRALYPNQLILPMSSCNRVIGAQRAMQGLISLHHLSITGLVDRDHRSDEEICSLRNQSLLVADVAEVENLFCVPAALYAATEQLKVSNPQAAVETAQARVISELQNSLNSQIAARSIAKIQFKLGGFGLKAGNANLSIIQAELAKHMADIDIGTVFKQTTDLFNNIVVSTNYESALRFYNCKGMISFVASAFGLNPRTYCAMITGIVRSEPSGSLAQDLRSRIS